MDAVSIKRASLLRVSEPAISTESGLLGIVKMINWLYIILIGLATDLITRNRSSSIVSNLVLATIGAAFGGFLLELAGKSFYGNTGLLVTAFACATISMGIRRILESNL